MFKGLKECKQLINDFCIREYGSLADFSDLKKVDIAYTTTEDDAEIQVSANLIDKEMVVTVSDVIVCKRTYKTLAEMIKREFSVLDFNYLVADGLI